MSGESGRILAGAGAKFDIVFADPPYKKGYGKQILAGLVEYKLLAPDSLVIIEHSRDDLIEVDNLGDVQDASLVKVDYREYGKSALSFFSFD
jgi:16S rRNA (guanine966-N2)-methyltransferase